MCQILMHCLGIYVGELRKILGSFKTSVRVNVCCY